RRQSIVANVNHSFSPSFAVVVTAIRHCLLANILPHCADEMSGRGYHWVRLRRRCMTMAH
ncbi:MAG: hypothetical protein ACLQUT_04990, partial [Thermoleophilia bacterium]